METALEKIQRGFKEADDAQQRGQQARADYAKSLRKEGSDPETAREKIERGLAAQNAHLPTSEYAEHAKNELALPDELRGKMPNRASAQQYADYLQTSQTLLKRLGEGDKAGASSEAAKLNAIIASANETARNYPQ